MHHIVGVIGHFAPITAVVDLSTSPTNDDIQYPRTTGAYQAWSRVELAKHPWLSFVPLPSADLRTLWVGAGPEAEHITKEQMFPEGERGDCIGVVFYAGQRQSVQESSDGFAGRLIIKKACPQLHRGFRGGRSSGQYGLRYGHLLEYLVERYGWGIV
jgi:hypothetical protein